MYPKNSILRCWSVQMSIYGLVWSCLQSVRVAFESEFQNRIRIAPTKTKKTTTTTTNELFHRPQTPIAIKENIKGVHWECEFWKENFDYFLSQSWNILRYIINIIGIPWRVQAVLITLYSDLYIRSNLQSVSRIVYIYFGMWVTGWKCISE